MPGTSKSRRGVGRTGYVKDKPRKPAKSKPQRKSQSPMNPSLVKRMTGG